MKTILINPFTKTITEQQYDGSLEGMYALLNCQMVEGVYCNDEGHDLFPETKDCLFVDEEGLFAVNQQYFIIDGKPLAGSAMTIGMDDQGETIESTATVEDLVSRIVWADAHAIREYCQKRGF